jgi:uncharacterized membrane protein YfcA
LLEKHIQRSRQVGLYAPLACWKQSSIQNRGAESQKTVESVTILVEQSHMTEQLSVVLVIFLAVFVQSLSGFGSALVAMSLLPAIIGIQVATPLVALVMIFIEVLLLLRYRQAFKWEAVWRVIAASIIGVPIGLMFLKRLDEQIALTALGVVVAGFGLYALMNIRLPTLSHPAWGYAFGFLAGIIGGAYNTSGPPVIMYGNCRGWQTEEFKSNLQGFFIISSLAIVIGHAWNNSLTPEVWHYFWLSIPATVIGIIAGTSLDRYTNPETFRKIVLILLVMIGIRLIVS